MLSPVLLSILTKDRTPAVAPGPTAYRYFEWYITATAGGGTQITQLGEAEIYTSLGGANALVTETVNPRASCNGDIANERAGEAFDGSYDGVSYYTSDWQTPVNFPHRLWFDVGSGNEIVPVQYGLDPWPDLSFVPTAWLFRGSNDPNADYTAKAWTQLDSQSGVTSGWSAGTVRKFTLP